MVNVIYILQHHIHLIFLLPPTSVSSFEGWLFRMEEFCLESTQSSCPRRGEAEWRSTARRRSPTNLQNIQRARSLSKPSRRWRANEAGSQRSVGKEHSERPLTLNRLHSIRKHQYLTIFQLFDHFVSMCVSNVLVSSPGPEHRQWNGTKFHSGRWSRRWIHHLVGKKPFPRSKGN